MTIISPGLIENLQNNGVVVYPTSTLPGLGCLPNKLALDNLYSLKNRPAEQPVSLGVADLEQAAELVEIPKIAEDLLMAFPRGSLTLILDAVRKLDDRLGGKRVAVRVLADVRAIELVKIVGPITATSANESGVLPECDTEVAARKLGVENFIPGVCPNGLGSTFVKFERDSTEELGWRITIIREGVVPQIDIMKWILSK